jgi:hypothetical protein
MPEWQGSSTPNREAMGSNFMTSARWLEHQGNNFTYTMNDISDLCDGFIAKRVCSRHNVDACLVTALFSKGEVGEPLQTIFLGQEP